MLLFRYLTREVLLSSLAVSSVLLLIITSTHLIRLLGDAAAGEISTLVVLNLVWNRIPQYLETLLPLGLFLGILLAHGRFYLDSEMVVMRACGLSHRRLVFYALGPALIVSLLVAFVSLYLTPTGMYEVKRIMADQRKRTELEILVPGAFQKTSSGQIVYARGVSDQGTLTDLFVSGVDSDKKPLLLVGVEGEQRFIEDQGRFLVVKDGFRYQGEQGSSFTELGFSEYGIRLPEPKLTTEVNHLDAIPTSELIGTDRVDYLGRLQWRLSLPVLALVVAILAVPLAKTSPRQGRYAKLIPSIILYQLYVGALAAARSAIEKGEVGPESIWGIHLVALGLALSFILFEHFWTRVLAKIPSVPKFARPRADAEVK